MSYVLDAGALVAFERGDRKMMRLFKEGTEAGQTFRTHGGVIGQVWRGGRGRQAQLALVLPAVEVHPLDDDLGRRAGNLLRNTGTSDVIDAALVLLAMDGDDIVTSDPVDLQHLAAIAGTHVELLVV